MSEQRGGIGGVLVSLATLLVTIIGAGVALLEYREAQQRERVERVFRYSDTLAGEGEANARINQLGDAFVLAWPALAQSAGGADATRAQLEKVTADWFVDTISYDPSLRSAVERMALFYDTLAVCIAEGLCDERTAKALFTQQAAAFASTAYPWVAHRNAEYFAATGIQAMCLRNRLCAGDTQCDGLPETLADCQ